MRSGNPVIEERMAGSISWWVLWTRKNVRCTVAKSFTASLYGSLNGCNSLHNPVDNWSKLLPSDRKNVDIHWPPQRGSTARCTCWSSADLCPQEGSSSPSFALIVDHQSSAGSKVKTQVRFSCWFWRKNVGTQSRHKQDKMLRTHWKCWISNAYLVPQRTCWRNLLDIYVFFFF